MRPPHAVAESTSAGRRYAGGSFRMRVGLPNVRVRPRHGLRRLRWRAEISAATSITSARSRSDSSVAYGLRHEEDDCS
jgi:hypothetical protein